MFCPKCGNNLPVGATFCGRCGTNVNQAQYGRAGNAAGVQSGGPQYGGPQYSTTNSQSVTGEGKYLAVSAIIALLLSGALIVVSACFLIYGIVFLHPRYIIFNLIRIVFGFVFLRVALSSARKSPSAQDRESAFMIEQLIVVLYLLVYVIEHFGFNSGFVENLELSGVLILLAISYFMLERPRTLLSDPFALLGIRNALQGMRTMQNREQRELADVRRVKAAGVNQGKTRLIRTIVGILGAVLATVSLYLPIFTYTSAYWGTTYGFTFVALVREGFEITSKLVAVVPVVICILMLVLYLLNRPGFAAILGLFHILCLIAMAILYNALINTNGTAIGVRVYYLILYFIAVIAIFCVPFIKIGKKDS